MLPTLKEFGITSPVYIRKIDSRGRWNPEECKSVEERAEKVANSLFKEEVYSIWLVTSDSDFYGAVASLSAKRTPKQQDVDFIWITEEELQEVGIVAQPKPEGDCLAVNNLHFNAEINSIQARKLCYNLITKNREPKRCTKKATSLILQEKEAMGCKAIKSNIVRCKCEVG